MLIDPIATIRKSVEDRRSIIDHLKSELKYQDGYSKELMEKDIRNYELEIEQAIREVEALLSELKETFPDLTR